MKDSNRSVNGANMRNLSLRGAKRLRGEAEANQQPRKPRFLRFARNRLRNPNEIACLAARPLASLISFARNDNPSISPVDRRLTRDIAKSLTLVELMVVLVLLSILALGFSSIYIFSHQNLVVAVRRIRLQNELSYFLEHISKTVTGTKVRGGAVGNVSQAVRIGLSGPHFALFIRVDSDRDGALSAADEELSYVATGAPLYQILLYDPSLAPNSPESICPNHIWTDFSTVTINPNKSYFDIYIQGCWDPRTGGCGTLDNPFVEMRGRIGMPSVSTD